MTVDAVAAWLLEGDPSIRWQVRRDLLDEPERKWSAERALVGTEGWGARLLAERRADGRWTKGLYTPKWTSTTYTLMLLRRLGLPRDHKAAVDSVRMLLDKQVWVFGSPKKPYWEACVAGMALSLAGAFDVDASPREALLAAVLEAQMPDGGWNCRRPRGAVHSSFHTTMNVLEGLREYAVAGGPRRKEVERAEGRAHEFLCAHRLYCSHRTGQVVDARMTRLTLPIGWRHDVLRGLDHFQSARAPRDERLADPIGVVRSKCLADGRWPSQGRQAGHVWFELERAGQPSRWNTLRALRVLRWWDGKRGR